MPRFAGIPVNSSAAAPPAALQSDAAAATPDPASTATTAASGAGPRFAGVPVDQGDTATPGHQNADGSYTPAKITVQGAIPVQDQPATVGDRADELRAAQSPSIGGSVFATANGLVNGVPVVGPAVTKASDFVLAQTLGRIEGEDPGQFMAAAEAARNATNDANPIANIGGQVVGAVGSMGAAGTVPAVAEALGMTGAKIVPRVVNSAVSNAVLSGGDAAVRGESPGQVAADTAYGAAGGAIIPAAGAAIHAVVAPVAERFQPAIGAIANADQEALRRVGSAIERDQRSGQDILRSGDLPVAQDNNIPLINADRGGETTRALVRSVANQSPEARATIEKVASDRFAGQGGRAENFVRRLFGGSADDLGYQQRLRTAADAANDPAYRAAYAAPGADAIWNEDLQQLMQSNKFRAAVRSAESRGTDRAAIDGVPAVKNPFVFNPDGSVSLKDGVYPSLRFWNQVKRNLDGMLDSAVRGAKPDRTVVSDLTALKGKLTGTLDNVVPEYRTARSGAGAYFGADDALEAGKKFAGQLGNLPEARAAFMKMSPPEKQAFAIGYSSSLIDTIRTAGDRTNVINRIFKSPASRQAVEMILGQDKAKQVEAYVRVEDLADKLRGALGNSTTARQLVELGIGAGAGYAVGGHDWQSALTGAALARGVRYGAAKADARVMQGVAKLLMSDDPTALDKAAKQAAKSPALLSAVERFGELLSAPVRAGALQATSQ